MNKILYIFLASGIFSIILLLNTSSASAQGNQFLETIVGEPNFGTIIEDSGDSGDGGGGGGGPQVKCESQNFRQCLKNQFNITVAGSPRDSDLQATYRGYKIVSGYKAFYAAFKKGRITITYSTSSTCPSSLWCSGAWATVDTVGNMTLYRRIWSSSDRYQNYFMIHEGAHVADNYLGRINENLYYNAYTLRKDRDCFNSIGVIKTYPASLLGSSPSLTRRQNETFAESVVNTIQCKNGGTCGPNGGSSASAIADWPSKCKYINKLILNKIN